MTIPDTRVVSCGDVSCEFLVDPIPRPAPAEFTVTMRPSEAKVQLVDHKKPGSLAILSRAQEILRDRGVRVADEILEKESASVAMDESMLDELARRGGLVLCGVSD